jgi:hypothetical protein
MKMPSGQGLFASVVRSLAKSTHADMHRLGKIPIEHGRACLPASEVTEEQPERNIALR